VTSAFSGCYNLESLYLPDSVESICESCFSGLRKLKNVHLGAGLTEIPNYAFSGCSSLETLVIPEKVSRLGASIFAGCGALYEVLFEDFAFKEKVRATDRMGSDENYKNGEADISWYCFQGAGTALYGHDFDESYKGTKFHRALQKVVRTTDWRKNIRNVLYSQLNYREGFSPWHLEGTNTKPYKTPASAAFWEWGHFAEAGRYQGVNGTTWCAAFVDWAWSMAGISPDYDSGSSDFEWKDTVYAGGTKEILCGDVIGVGKTHVAMAEKAEVYKDDYVKLYIMQGNAGDRQVCTEIVYYDKETGAAIPVDESTGEPYGFDRSKEKLILDESKPEDLKIKSSYGSYRDKYDLRYISQTDLSGVTYHTMTFDPGEGGSVPVSSRIFGDGAYYGALPDAEKADFVFDGWYTAAEGGDLCLPYDRAGDKDVTLYAHYHKDATAVKGLTLSRKKAAVTVDGTYKLSAVISPRNALNKKVTWRSGNDEVVTVKDGVLTGVKEGTATVFARADGGPYVAYCDVTVEKKDSSGSGDGSGGSGGQVQDVVTYAVEGGNIYFDKNSGTITKADKTVTKAVIPAYIDGVAVKIIGKEAFYQCADLTEILLPEGLEEIGQSGLEATGLTHVTIP
ncbi:MAG: leucine-rich repeat protein, partial [Lachnospiraceae bacterium]|nr:leucine-rich repeat protein [Lachnospiraceae bacterium]